MWYKLLRRIEWSKRLPCRTITRSQRFQVQVRFLKILLQKVTFELFTAKWNIHGTNQPSEERVAATQVRVHLRRNQGATAGRFSRIGHFLSKKKCKEEHKGPPRTDFPVLTVLSAGSWEGRKPDWCTLNMPVSLFVRVFCFWWPCAERHVE